MTRDDIIRMAWQAFSDPSKEDAWRNGFWTVTQEELDDFASLVADAEREACAKVCEDHWRNNGNAMECADAIRARGDEIKPYCHMGKMCIGCSPQLIEGICPDSRAGRIVAELVGALQEVVADNNAANRLSWNDRAEAAIAKATGGEG